jgi:hypothetical protein
MNKGTAGSLILVWTVASLLGCVSSAAQAPAPAAADSAPVGEYESPTALTAEPKTSPRAKEAAAMVAPGSASATGDPKLSAEEVGKRFLKLIGKLRSKSDLNLKLVQDTMEIKLSSVPGDPNHLASEASVAPDWSYVVGYIEATPSIDKATFLEFRNTKARFSDMTLICAVDFDSYHNALKSMDFRDSPIYGEIGQLEDWRYFKGDIAISIVTQSMIPGERDRLCVKSISTLN